MGLVVDGLDRFRERRARSGRCAAGGPRAVLAVLRVAGVEAPVGIGRDIDVEPGLSSGESDREGRGRLQRGVDLRARVVARREARHQGQVAAARALEHGARPVGERCRRLDEKDAAAEITVPPEARAVVLVVAADGPRSQVEVMRAGGALEPEAEVVEHEAVAIVPVVADLRRVALAPEHAELRGEPVAPVAAEARGRKHLVGPFVEQAARRARGLREQQRLPALVADRRGVAGDRAVGEEGARRAQRRKRRASGGTAHRTDGSSHGSARGSCCSCG